MNQPEPQKVRRVRQKPRQAEVIRVQRLTPHMVRVVLGGPELDGFTTGGPAAHFKVNFPPPGEPKLVLPEWGPDGPILREGRQRPLNRTYTPRRWDAQAGELAVDFLLHGEGIGSTWAQQVQPGQVVAVSHQPAGAYKIDASADWYLIGGDESALPAIGTILETLPTACSAHVFVEAADETEELKLDSPARFQVTWLHHGGAPRRVGRRLEQAVQEFSLPDGTGRVWVGCEAGVMRDIPPPAKRTWDGPGSCPHARLLEIRHHEPSRQRPWTGSGIDRKSAVDVMLFVDDDMFARSWQAPS